MALNIVAVGEILWDMLPSGKQLGGAPANFAFHAAELGARSQVISRVGDDSLGRELIEQARRRGLAVDAISVDPAAPTGTVGIELEANGHHHFTIHENVAWDRLIADAPAQAIAAHADAVCFGSLGQRCATSRAAIQALVRATPATALRVLDINLRQGFFSEPVLRQSLTLANVLKLNTDELSTLSIMLELRGEPVERLGQLADRFDLRLVALTRGVHGSLLYSRGESAEHPGLPVTLRDSIGAGDAFCAAMTLGLLADWDLDEINRCANEVAAEVCSHHGAFAPLPTALRNRFLFDMQTTLPSLQIEATGGAMS